MSRRLAALLASVTIAACSPGGDGASPDAASAAASSPAGGASAAATATASGTAAARSTAGSAAVTDDDCVVTASVQPGTLDAGDAGSVEIERDGNDLRLGEVTPADGWSVESDDDGADDDEIEVEFKRADRELKFKAEIDGDAIRVEVCEGDD